MELARLDTPLKDILRKEGRTQTWLAAEIGVDARQVWGWVHGLHCPAEDTQSAIAKALVREVSELWPESQEADADAESKAAA